MQKQVIQTNLICVAYWQLKVQINMWHFCVSSTFVIHCTNTFCSFKNVQKFPSTPLKVPVLLLFHFREPPSPLFTSPMSLSAAHFLYRWFHPTSRTLAFFPFPPVKQSLSVLLPDLIISNVRELVASQESHGRQLHSEVGHMVRWVTRAQRSQPRDSLSEGINTPHTNMKESPYFKNW